MSTRESSSVVLTGATGRVGTYSALFLARLGLADVLYLASRDTQRLGTVLHNTRVCALLRESHTRVEPLALDLLDAARTAEALRRLRPTLLINSAALLSLYPFFPALRKRQARLGLVAGFGHTLPKDLAILWPLMRAVRDGSPETCVVNLAAPDTAHAMLHPLGLSPNVGAGTIDSTAQGIRLGVAQSLKIDPQDVDVRLVCHHAIRRMPVGTVPFFLRAYARGQEVSSSLEPEKLISEAVDVTGVETMTTPVTSNAAITAASAVEAARAILLDTRQVRHGAGAEGWPGGTPVRLGREGAEVVLPEGLSPEKARGINQEGVRATGVETILPDGSITFTEREQLWLRQGLGLSWKGMRLEDALPMSAELEAAYRRMGAEERG
jgi:malate/lactate dehydrogenase